MNNRKDKSDIFLINKIVRTAKGHINLKRSENNTTKALQSK